MPHFNEHSLEMAIMELFTQQGYSYQSGETIHKELSEVLLRMPFRLFRPISSFECSADFPVVSLGVGAEFEDVAGRAVQDAADGVEGREAHGLGFAGLEDREVGNGDAHALAQLVERHLAAGHHHIKIHDNHNAQVGLDG